MADNARTHTNAPEHLEPLVDAEAVGRVIGRPARWVREQAAAGALPAYKVGGVWRFRLSEVLGRLGA